MSDSQNLRRALRAFVMRGEGSFESLALSLFAHQYANNLAFARYANKIKLTPDTVNVWSQVPAVASDVFRHVALFCGNVEEAPFVFRTSGTTHGKRGEHYLRDLTLYHESALTSIDRWLLPRGPMPALMLAPHPSELPDSSLSSMLGLIAEERANGDAFFAWEKGQLDVEGAITWLEQRTLGPDAPPVQVLGTSFAFIHLLDTLESTGVRVTLPPGSIVMPTGGTKGRVREFSAPELEEALIAGLGVERSGVVAEYGMTELGSQCYDPRGVEGLVSSPEGQLLVAPPWCRVRAWNALENKEAEPGEVGLLRFYDLSNLDSVFVVQTSDRGSLLQASPAGDRFVLLGRAPDALPRGCSLTVEEAMSPQEAPDDADAR
jgi:hypothetical protein